MIYRQDEKEILIKELCEKFPYELKVKVYDSEIDTLVSIEIIGNYIGIRTINHSFLQLEDIKPILRPMSDMTEEEKNEFETMNWRVDEYQYNEPWCFSGDGKDVVKGIQWLNKHHFDYKHLISTWLAIEADKETYKN